MTDAPKQPATEAERRLRAWSNKAAIDLLALREAHASLLAAYHTSVHVTHDDWRECPMTICVLGRKTLADTAPAAAEIEEKHANLEAHYLSARMALDLFLSGSSSAMEFGQRVFDRDAPAAAEIEARIRADEYRRGYVYGSAHAITDWLASPEAEQRLAAALMAGGYVRNYASRLGKFNDAYWQQAAASILAALREQPAEATEGQPAPVEATA